MQWHRLQPLNRPQGIKKHQIVLKNTRDTVEIACLLYIVILTGCFVILSSKMQPFQLMYFCYVDYLQCDSNGIMVHAKRWCNVSTSRKKTAIPSALTLATWSYWAYQVQRG